MASIKNITTPQIAPRRVQEQADPFLRKNQVWFQKSLPPALSAQRTTKKSKNNLEQMALNLLNPNPMDRQQLAPAHYKQNLLALQNKLQRLGNQLPQTATIMTLLHNETNLISAFNQARLTSVAC